VKLVSAAVELVMGAKAQNPKVFAPLLRSSYYWPVLIGTGREGFEGIQQEIAGMGDDSFHRKGFKAAVFEKWQQLPARKWAYAIKTILEWNRMLAFAAAEHVKNWRNFKKYLQKERCRIQQHMPDWSPNAASCLNSVEHSPEMDGDWQGDDKGSDA
jgi:hypothetical protein